MERRKEKSTGLFTGIFAALAGIAIGVGGKMIYDEVVKDEQEEQRKREMALSRSQYEKDNNNKEVKENMITRVDSITDSDVEYESFFCPISQEIMKDPVITPGGVSYDRKSICDWLKKNKTCPLTKTNLCENDLITNYALKCTIEDYIKKIKKTADK